MSKAGNGFVPKENISKNKQTPPVSVPLSLPLLPPPLSSIVCLAVAL